MSDDRPILIDEDDLNQHMVQISTRLPLRLRLKLDRYLQWMERPPHERPKSTREWPRTLQGTVMAALEDYLATHEPYERKGPDQTPRKAIKATKKRTISEAEQASRDRREAPKEVNNGEETG